MIFFACSILAIILSRQRIITKALISGMDAQAGMCFCCSHARKSGLLGMVPILGE